LRTCLAEEFSSLYILHLRGNQRTAGELSRKEGGKIFGSGSRSPIAISLLVKNPDATQTGKIYFHDIGDYLTRDEKLSRLAEFCSIAGVESANQWQVITPDEHGDWLKQRNSDFSKYIVLGDKKGGGPKLFENYSLGVVTNRDAWCYNSSRKAVIDNVGRLLDFYNQEVERFADAHPGVQAKQREKTVDVFIDTDSSKISWTHNLKMELCKGRKLFFDESCIVSSLYRPFAKQYLYFNRRLNERVYQIPRLFPDSTACNVLIGVSASDSRSSYSVFITNVVPSLHAVDMVGSQYFPLYVYDDTDVEHDIENQTSLFRGDQVNGSPSARRDGITDEGLAHFCTAYPGEDLSKDDVFYYVYGLLHSLDYRERFADSLGKELPRIPCVKSVDDFWHFSQAGRKLARLHLSYEEAGLYPASIQPRCDQLVDRDYKVEKMRHGRKGKEKDLSVIHYNDRITVSEIPLNAYEYIVNGKSAIEWVMERQCVKADKASGIVNDANDWAVETMANPKYPLELLLRVITVSVESMKIVNTLPGLDV
jgi:predicted helicase